MRLKIPFYKQTSQFNCGPVALYMILSYFSSDIDLDHLEKLIGINEGKGTTTIQMATASSKLGYETIFLSKHVHFNKENMKFDFYQKYSEFAHRSKQLVEDAKNEGVIVKEVGISLNELLGKFEEGFIPLILLDWNIVRGTKHKGYQGHFVPVVGYDEENVYVHNPGLDNPEQFLPIKRNVFDEARKAEGTDEDLVLIKKID